jgi:hypothetical protein
VTENRRDLKSIGPSISEPRSRSVAKIVETKVRDLGAKRKYNQTQWLMISAGKR